MGLDERLFGWFYRTLNRRKSQAPGVSEHAVTLEPLRARFSLLASALAGVSVEVKVAERVGGVRGHHLLLPAVVDRYDSPERNLEVYLHRVAFGAESMRMGFSTAGLPAAPGARELATLAAAVGVRRELKEALPALFTLRERLREADAAPPDAEPKPEGEVPGEREGAPSQAVGWVAALLYSEQASPADPSWVRALLKHPPHDQSALQRAFEAAAEMLGPDLPLLVQAYATQAELFGELLAPPPEAQLLTEKGALKDAMPAPGATEIDAPNRDEVELIEIGASPEDENPLVHSFEKVHTLDDYAGGSKRQDGEDNLEEQLQALDELDLKQVIRTGETSHSVYRADGLFEGMAGEIAGGEADDDARPHRRYDEWNTKTRSYQKGWCTLYLEPPRAPVTEALASERVRHVRREHGRQIRELRALFEALDATRRWRTRQLDGAEVDLDALVQRRSALLAGHSPDERVYAARRKHEREVATLILLDLSLSSDSYVQNRRILDVGQDALLVLGDVLEPARDHFAVAGFFSHTRRDCRWMTLKAFDEPWREGARRLLGVQPSGYTRIGPALRHGVHALSQHGARRKLLLLVTDGRPTDYDRYEGRHGVDDVRQAFREAEQEGVHPFAITIAKETTSVLPQLFGRGHFETLQTPDQLPRALAEVYSRLAL